LRGPAGPASRAGPPTAPRRPATGGRGAAFRGTAAGGRSASPCGPAAGRRCAGPRAAAPSGRGAAPSAGGAWRSAGSAGRTAGSAGRTGPPAAAGGAAAGGRRPAAGGSTPIGGGPGARAPGAGAPAVGGAGRRGTAPVGARRGLASISLARVLWTAPRRACRAATTAPCLISSLVHGHILPQRNHTPHIHSTSVVLVTPRETRSAALEAALLVGVPAATYSPTRLPGQYHRRWRA
jgi:hypothetical protein